MKYWRDGQRQRQRRPNRRKRTANLPPRGAMIRPCPKPVPSGYRAATPRSMLSPSPWRASWARARAARSCGVSWAGCSKGARRGGGYTGTRGARGPFRFSRSCAKGCDLRLRSTRHEIPRSSTSHDPLWRRRLWLRVRSGARNSSNMAAPMAAMVGAAAMSGRNAWTA